MCSLHFGCFLNCGSNVASTKNLKKKKNPQLGQSGWLCLCDQSNHSHSVSDSRQLLTLTVAKPKWNNFFLLKWTFVNCFHIIKINSYKVYHFRMNYKCIKHSDFRIQRLWNGVELIFISVSQLKTRTGWRGVV